MENNPVSTPGYRGTGDTGRADMGASATEQLKEQAQEVVRQIPQKAGQLAEQARDQMKSQLTTQKEHATGGLESVAQAIRQTGEHLQQQNQGTLRGFADSAAEQVDRLSGYLREKDVDQILREVEGFARRQPAVFLGGAFALGLLAARFFKSSSRDGDWNRADYRAGYDRPYSAGDGPAAGLRTALLPAEIARSPVTPSRARSSDGE